jgi:hypothetical protein
MRRSLSPLLTLIVIAVGLGLTACSPQKGCSGATGQCRASPEVSLSVPTDATLTYDSKGDYAGVEGTLRGERSGKRACLYVNSKRGLAKGRVNLVFPKGYSSTDQLGLHDDKHRLVAKSGDPVVVSISPKLLTATPPGCSTPGAGTAQALHLELPGAP